MARLPRVQFPGATYHVVLQGSAARGLFADDTDRRRMLGLLAAYKRRFGLKLYAYCLLDAAVHLLLETPRGDLSRAMQGLGTAFTKSLNARHARSGPVFRGRYRARLIDKETQLLAVSRLIHTAPVRAGAASRPWRYPWSSCRAYTESASASGGRPLVDTETLLKPLARQRLRQSVKYFKYLKEGDPLEPLPEPPAPALNAQVRLRRTPGTGADKSRLAPALNAQGPGGSARGADKSRLAPAATRAQRRASAEGHGVGRLIDLPQALIEAGRRNKVDPADILSRLRTADVSRARREIAFRAWEAGMGVTDIGAALRRTPAAVCRMVRRSQRAADPPPA